MRFLVESNLLMILGVFTSQIANKIECVIIIIYTTVRHIRQSAAELLLFVQKFKMTAAAILDFIFV